MLTAKCVLLRTVVLDSNSDRASADLRDVVYRKKLCLRELQYELTRISSVHHFSESERGFRVAATLLLYTPIRPYVGILSASELRFRRVNKP